MSANHIIFCVMLAPPLTYITSKCGDQAQFALSCIALPNS